MRFAVVDLFAGPGGLAEGFSAIRDRKGKRVLPVVLSVEKDPTAHSTLLLRGFLRQFDSGFPDQYYSWLRGDTAEPDWRRLFPTQWRNAESEALQLELGIPSSEKIIDARLKSIRQNFGDDTILIGGPPCQAYSLVGRARNRGIKDYKAEKDHRHFLYKEYIRIVEQLRPAAFVMENVKGMLSSSVEGDRIFDRVLQDLASIGKKAGGYRLLPLAPNSGTRGLFDQVRPSSDFVLKAEEFGIPQARHRVIVVGIRENIAAQLNSDIWATGLLQPSRPSATLTHVLKKMPALRSGLSRVEDTDAAWRIEVSAAARRIAKMALTQEKKLADTIKSRAQAIAAQLRCAKSLERSRGGPAAFANNCPDELQKWLFDAKLNFLVNNETRKHMSLDLDRYLFAAIYAECAGVSPKASAFPDRLAPDHQNWESGKFADRFRVQIWNSPSTTITSHISKDGHYFIHPDPLQCRSLTVREAARLQTFPDNYFFRGNRTGQYIQVGNAVPPLLAKKIAEKLYETLTQQG